MGKSTSTLGRCSVINIRTCLSTSKEFRTTTCEIKALTTSRTREGPHSPTDNIASQIQQDGWAIQKMFGGSRLATALAITKKQIRTSHLTDTLREASHNGM